MVNPTKQQTIVQGDHLEFSNTPAILRHFRINTYGLQVKTSDQEINRDNSNIAIFHYIGMDRYKDFFVVYDIDWDHSIQTGVYVIYDKHKNFNPKNVFNDLNSVDYPLYLINELFVEDHMNHRVTRIIPFVPGSHCLLKLIQLVKQKLQFYPLVDQYKINREIETHRGDDIMKNSIPSYAIPDNLFLGHNTVAEMLIWTICPDLKVLEVTEFERTGKPIKIWKMKDAV